MATYSLDKDLALKLGLSTNAISQYITGKRKPDFNTIQKLIDLGISPLFIFSDGKDPFDKNYELFLEASKYINEKNKSEFVTATVNERNFDNNGDSSVVHVDPKYFTYNLASTTVDVPYSIYKAYVQRMYNQYNYSNNIFHMLFSALKFIRMQF